VAAAVRVRKTFGPVVAIAVVALLLALAGVAGPFLDLSVIRQKAADSVQLLQDSIGRSDESGSEREILFSEGMHLFRTGDLIGVAPGRTKHTLADQAAPYVKEAHNDYVATLVERGLLGGIGLIILISAIARTADASGRPTPSAGRGSSDPQTGVPARVGVCVPGRRILLRSAPLPASVGIPGPCRRTRHDGARPMASVTQARRSGTLGPRRRRLPGRAVLDNLGSRIVAMGALAVVTVLVARSGGPSDVGVLALLRVLPGLAAVLAACGLPSAMGYFIAGPDRDHPRLWPTIIAVMVAGGLAGMLVWFALAPLIHRYFISSTSLAVVTAAGVTVGTQLPVAVAKACLQGLGGPSRLQRGHGR